MFFVLNSGRSGSRTVAKVLSQSPTCECLHEPEPRLIAEATRYRYGELDPEAVGKTLRLTRRPEEEGRTYGETANKLALLVPVLVQEFPDAHMVWLVRDGRAAVASAVQRGWFSAEEEADPANDWQRWRLRGDRAGVVARDVWASWSQFQKVCWLWRYTNGLIQFDLEGRVPRNRRMTVRVERLGETLPDLCELLEIEPTTFVIDRANRRKQVDTEDAAVTRSTNVVGDISDWRDWDADRRETFEDVCGDLMDDLYPEWRDEGGGWRPVATELSERDEELVVPAGTDGPHTSGHDPIAPIRADLSELKLLRGEFRSALRQHERVLRGLESSREKLVERVEHLEEENRILENRSDLLEDAQARLDEVRCTNRELRGELSQVTGERDRVAEQLSAAKEDIQRWQVKFGAAEDRGSELAEQVQGLRDEITHIEASESFRIGHAVVRTAKSPIVAFKFLLRILVRMAKFILPKAVKGALKQFAGRRLSPTLMRRIHRAAGTQGEDEGEGRGSRADTSRADDQQGRPAAGTTEDQSNRRSGLLEPKAGGRPLYLFVVMQATESDLRRHVERILWMSEAEGFLPMFVTDTSQFRILRKHDIPFEYIPPAAEWMDRYGAVGWPEYFDGRLGAILEEYDPERIIALESDGGGASTTVDPLLPIVRSAPTG